LKPRRANHAPICSNVPTAEANTKLTQKPVHSGSINSTETSTTKNNKNFTKVEVT